MNVFRRFIAVGVLATLVDVSLFIALSDAAGWPVWFADAAAVALATLVSWVVHGVVTFPDDPSVRWYRNAGSYLRTATSSLAADVAVVSVVYAAFGPSGIVALLLTKAAGLVVAFLVRVATYRNTMFAEVRDDQRARVDRQAPPGALRLSVVVPAFREADRIADTVRRIHADLDDIAADGGLEVVVVDDGSPDDTAERAEAAGAEQVLRESPNRGKGAAVRAGVAASRGRTVAFTDADLSYAPDQIRGLLAGVEQGWDVVVGSRQHTDTMTVVRAGRLREVGGRIINQLTAIVLLGRYRDTQCGLKAMRSDVAKALFAQTRIDGFAFDIEVFHLVERYRLTLREVPVEVVNSSRSTVHVARDAMRLVADLFRIRRNGRVGLYETDDPAVAPRAD